MVGRRDVGGFVGKPGRIGLDRTTYRTGHSRYGGRVHRAGDPRCVLCSLVWTIYSVVRLVPPFLVPSLYNGKCRKETRSGSRVRPLSVCQEVTQRRERIPCATEHPGNR